MRFGRSVARNWSRAGVRQRLVAARRLVVGSVCQSTGESWRSLGHTVGRVTVTGDGCRFGRTVCLPAAALFSLRLGEPCDRGRPQRLTAHCPVKKKHGIIIVIPIAAARTEEIPIAAAGGQTWTETELWWSFLCNNVHSSEATHIASGALCAPPFCTSPWLLAALPPVLALLSLGQLQAALLLF